MSYSGCDVCKTEVEPVEICQATLIVCDECVQKLCPERRSTDRGFHRVISKRISKEVKEKNQ